jgi:hypothetical protein
MVVRNSRIISFSALTAVLAIIAPVAMSQGSQQANSSVTSGCLATNLAEIDQEYDFPIRQPNLALIADKAALQGVDTNRKVIVLYYADFSICPFDRSAELMMKDGLVMLTIYALDERIKDGSDFQDQQYSFYTSIPSNAANIQIIEVNGYKGIGWEPYDGQSIVRLKGEVIESTPAHGPGGVKFYSEEDRSAYYISADKPLNEILKIAESIS